jgi:hypothetical protein
MKPTTQKKHGSDALTDGGEAGGDFGLQQMRNMRTQIDRLRLEVMALQKCLSYEIPTFEDRYAHILAEMMKQLPPE